MEQIWLNNSILAPLEGLGGIVATTDQETSMPFVRLAIIGAGAASVTATVSIDDPAKGDFTPASLSVSGFSGPVGGPYQKLAATAGDAQAALRGLVFAPTRNRVAPDLVETTSLTVSVSDGTTTRTDSAFVKALSVNDSPSASDDEGAGFTTTEGQVFTTDNVLDNDVDLDPGDAISITKLSAIGTLGTVVNEGDGTFTYDPGNLFDSLPLGDSATDTFSYTIQDSRGAISLAEVVITIEGQNTAPVALADSLTLNESATPIVIANLLLVNDEDPDTGDKIGLLIEAIDTSSTLGTVALLASDVVTYLPSGNLAPGVTAIDTFRYSVVDTNGKVSASAEVVITIVGQADPPTALADALTIGENDPVVDITALVLGNDLDPDPGQNATFSITEVDTTDTIGTVSLVSGALTYNPDFQFDALPDGGSATDSFSYTITDENGLESSSAVVVTIMGDNDRPYVVLDYPVVKEGAAASDITERLLSNDIDQDQGDQASLKIISVDAGGSSGTATFAGGRVSYSPDPSLQLKRDEIVTDTFSYTIEDPLGVTAEAFASTFHLTD